MHKISQIIASDVETVTRDSGIIKNLENISLATLTTNRQQTLMENCKDQKYSCIFWLKAHKNVCTEQRSFMKINCAFTCGLCEK